MEACDEAVGSRVAAQDDSHGPCEEGSATTCPARSHHGVDIQIPSTKRTEVR